MTKNGLTVSMIMLAESANYGEGVGNITTLKKMSRGNYNQYSYISRQAIRYNIVNQLMWDNTPVCEQKKVVQFAPDATILDYPEIDLFGYMKTTAKDDSGKKGGASTRSAVVRLSNAISLEPYNGDLDFLTNMGLSKRQGFNNVIAQTEIHCSYYTYTITIDLERIGIDGDLEIENTEKAKRVNNLLDTIQFLYRDIKGRRENLAPLFAVGGVFERKNPYYEHMLNIKNNCVVKDTINDIIASCDDTKNNTLCGVVSGIFANDDELKAELKSTSISDMFSKLKQEVCEYYG